jgi:hypothetical protein
MWKFFSLNAMPHAGPPRIEERRIAVAEERHAIAESSFNRVVTSLRISQSLGPQPLHTFIRLWSL